MMLQNIFVPASTLNRISSLIALAIGEYRKVQTSPARGKIMEASIACQSILIEHQSIP